MLEWSIDNTLCSHYTTYTKVTSRLNIFYAFLLFPPAAHMPWNQWQLKTHTKKVASNLMGLKLVLQFADLNPNKQQPQFFKLWLIHVLLTSQIELWPWPQFATFLQTSIQMNNHKSSYSDFLFSCSLLQ